MWKQISLAMGTCLIGGAVTANAAVLEGTIHEGDTFTVTAENVGPVGSGAENLMLVELTMTDTSGNVANTFAGTISGSLHQEQAPGFTTTTTPTDRTWADFGLEPSELDTYFHTPGGSLASVTSPFEADGLDTPSEESPVHDGLATGFGEEVGGEFAITGVSSSSWHFLSLVAPVDETLNFDFTVGNNMGVTDDVSGNFTVIPEPGSIALLGLGGLALLGRRRRRKASSA